MDSGTKSLINVLLSVLAPVLVLDHCSATGPGLLELGTTRAMALALALPLGCGVWMFIERRRLDPITLFGLMGTILTGVITIYANTGDGSAIRPDTPWWYAAKEALIAALLGGAMLVTARRRDSMLRLFLYSDSLFDVARIEKRIAENELQQPEGKARQQAPAQTPPNRVKKDREHGQCDGAALGELIELDKAQDLGGGHQHGALGDGTDPQMLFG